MANKAKKTNLTTFEKKRKADAYALACLIYDIWREKKQKEKSQKKVRFLTLLMF